MPLRDEVDLVESQKCYSSANLGNSCVADADVNAQLGYVRVCLACSTRAEVVRLAIGILAPLHALWARHCGPMCLQAACRSNSEANVHPAVLGVTLAQTGLAIGDVAAMLPPPWHRDYM